MPSDAKTDAEKAAFPVKAVPANLLPSDLCLAWQLPCVTAVSRWDFEK